MYQRIKQRVEENDSGKMGDKRIEETNDEKTEKVLALQRWNGMSKKEGRRKGRVLLPKQTARNLQLSMFLLFVFSLSQTTRAWWKVKIDSCGI